MLVALPAVSVASTVVQTTNVVWTFGNTGYPGANHTGSIYQNALRTDITSALFGYDGDNLRCINENVDEGSDWYFVNANAAFGTATIAANAFSPLVTLGPTLYPPVAVDSLQDIYLGIATSRGFPINRTVFGWVRLRDVDGVLVMIDNAVSYDSPGIYIGTTTIVPEPAAAGLVLAASTLLTRRRRRA